MTYEYNNASGGKINMLFFLYIYQQFKKSRYLLLFMVLLIFAPFAFKKIYILTVNSYWTKKIAGKQWFKL